MILGMTKYDEYREKIIEQKRIEDIHENHIVFFVLFFVETYCMDICKRKITYKVSRPPLPLKNMLGLVLLSKIKFSYNHVWFITRKKLGLNYGKPFVKYEGRTKEDVKLFKKN